MANKRKGSKRRSKASPADATEALVRIELPPVTDYLSTGCTILDLAIADQLPGGFPGGRISHVYGLESTGKTVFAQEPLGSVQRAGGEAWFVDAEFTLDSGRVNLFGLDISKDFHYCTPQCIEDLFDVVVKGALKDRTPDSPSGAISIDSLSALPSKVELEEDLSATGYGTTRAKQLSRAFRTNIWALNQANLALIFIDQVRSDIGSPFNKYTVSGGMALNYYASTCVFLSMRGKLLNRHDIPVGVKIGFRVEKNKVAPPFREGVLRLLFDFGIDDVGTNLQWLKEASGDSGAWYECGDGVKKQGLNAAIKYAEDNELEDIIIQSVYDLWRKIHEPTIVRKPRIRK